MPIPTYYTYSTISAINKKSTDAILWYDMFLDYKYTLIKQF